MNKNNYCVIMAGGAGTRFWPLSRNNRPKQFLDILGVGKTLLQLTFDRFAKICDKENILVVTGTDYKDLVFEQLPDIKKDRVLLEPMKRNTAPCVAYANTKIKAENPDANIVVTPADHIILDETNFINAINSSLDFTEKNDVLLTLGIKPNRPETGYGYIQMSNKPDAATENTSFRKVKAFTEKPVREMAEIFLKSGDFFWNAGIFVWKLSSIENAFKLYLPEVFELFDTNSDAINSDKENEIVLEVYKSCKNISIDYGIMEKAENVYVLPSDFGWSDLGTWSSLHENLPKDNNNNSVSGDNIITYDTSNCIIRVPDEKLVVVNGLKDFIVAESDNILLICNKKDEQNLRQIVNDIKITKGEQYI